MKFVSITPDNVSEYETIVETQHKPSFVKLYRTNCGYCQMIKPAWDALENNANISDLDIAIIEVREDALESINHESTKNFQGFPTIRLVINGKIKKEYEGSRSTDDMVKFIKENLGNDTKQSGGRRLVKKRTCKKHKHTKRTKRHVKKRSHTKKRNYKK